MEDRLSRMRLMVGEKGLKRLEKAHVLVAGCGAVCDAKTHFGYRARHKS